MTASTVYQPPVTFAFSTRELRLLVEAVTIRAFDLAWTLDQLDKVGDDGHRDELTTKIANLDALRDKIAMPGMEDEE